MAKLEIPGLVPRPRREIERGGPISALLGRPEKGAIYNSQVRIDVVERDGCAACGSVSNAKYSIC